MISPDIRSRWCGRPARVAAALTVLLLAGLGGCGHDDPVAPAPGDAPPETRAAGASPVPLEAGFSIRLSWSGSDAEGDLDGFEWRLASVGPDGELLPDDGEGLHAWRFTTDRETTLILGAGDVPAADGSGIAAGVSFAGPVYVFMVRAVDAAGQADPSPAEVGFTSVSLLPRVYVDEPARMHEYESVQPMPPTVRFGFTGLDPDFPLGAPTQFRTLVKPAWLVDHYVGTRVEFEYHVDELCSFADPAWSDWQAYPVDPAQRQVTVPDLPVLDGEGRQILYLFAVQVMDRHGAPSIDRRYSWNVQNFYINDAFAPLLTVQEPELGSHTSAGLYGTATADVMSGQELRFSWSATAESYNGEIASYRYGWDVTDVNDPNDPGWAVAPGLTPQHMAAPVRVFWSGLHTLTVEARDTDDQLTRFVWSLSVVPIPDPSYQKPLLLVDDVRDRLSNGWPSSGPGLPLDNDAYRDDFWLEVLGGPGGVADFGGGDVIDTEADPLSMRDLVEYRVVLWTSRFAAGNFVWNELKPLPDGTPQGSWFHLYLKYAGNVLLVGSRSARQFVHEQDWLLPFLFDSAEDAGPWELPDGTTVNLGTLFTPYRSFGVAAFDQTESSRVWGGGQRRRACAGLKGLVPDEDFAAGHPTFAAAVPGVILTDADIDWRDLDPAYRDELQPYTWGFDEFYDVDVAGRSTPWSPVDCEGAPCLEPMFRGLSRFDWVADLHAQAGDPDWPGSMFTPAELASVCGDRTFAPGADRTLTSGVPVGFLSHRLEADKPLERGDVVWGFDPYRFDREGAKAAVRWVLGEHFGLLLEP